MANPSTSDMDFFADLAVDAAELNTPQMLPPPIDTTFDSSDDAKAYQQTWAEAHGYALVTSRSAKGGRYLYFICDRGGEYRNTRKIQDEDRQRKHSTRKNSCSFRSRIFLKVGTNGEEIWSIAVDCAEHSGHEASVSTLAHPILRRFDVASREQVLDMVRHGTSARQIVPFLAQRVPPLLVTAKDVSNLIQTHRREKLQGLAPSEALLDWLVEQKWPHRTLLTRISGETHRLDGLLFSHPKALKLLHRFGTVITVDATYNTNQNRMPLLHFVGLTSSNRSFTAALAFLPDETTMTYMWSFNALKEIAFDFAPDVIVTDADAAISAAILNTLPNSAHVLCQWHIRQNVSKTARPLLQDEDEFQRFLHDFDTIRGAPTFDALEDAVDVLQNEWSDTFPALVHYIDLKLSAEHLWVNAYIDRHPHMGTRATSKTEGAHATLKKFLHSRHGNLFTVTQAVNNHFVAQHTHIASDFLNDRQKIPLPVLGDPFFSELTVNVSRYALNILKTQDELARRAAAKEKAREQQVVRAGDAELPEQSLQESASSDSPCCIIPATMGLPCRHTMRLLHELELPLPLTSIHPQWRTAAGMDNPRLPRVLDPLLPRKKQGRPSTTSSGRILTGNEKAEQQHAKSKRRCRNCHQPSHDSAHCPQPCGKCQSTAHRLNQCPEA
ncbi:hypothetical protein CF336_g9072 [Tilletia laevis]|nr:hypothetical protein CF336_g9072 [Tilletia laevis]